MVACHCKDLLGPVGICRTACHLGVFLGSPWGVGGIYHKGPLVGVGICHLGEVTSSLCRRGTYHLGVAWVGMPGRSSRRDMGP